jgi:type I restriction enzyme S subunit
VELGSHFFSDGYRVISAKNIKGRQIDTSIGEQRFVDEPTYRRWMRSPLLADDVILTSEAPLGEPAYVDAEFAWCLGQRLFGIRTVKSKLHGRFLFYALQASPVRDDMLSRATGATAQGIRQAELKKVQLPLPPLVEQQRIVGILDEAFEGITTAKVNAEKNLHNARALFESHLQYVFTQGGKEWKRTTVGDQVILQRGFDITKDQQNEGAVPVVSSGGIKSFHDRAMVQAPGVVIGRKGTLGKAFYLENDFWPHDTTLWVRDFKGNVPRLVYYFFTGLDVKKLNSGTANPALNRNHVHPVEVHWPPATLQKVLVEKLDRLSAETQRLESVYQQKLAALDELRRSLLHQAFSEEL